MKTTIIAALLIAVTAATVYFYPSLNAGVIKVTPTFHKPPVVNPVKLNPQSSQSIELVFVLDTTGSMSGLIQAAKDNIWSIASSMASAQSAPTIKMGLVAYRDRGDAYVTRVVDLSEDLDTNYGTLMGFQAGGGGDHPESVNKALHDAVTQMSWSKDENTYRVIFLVGDAPPQSRYRDEMKFPQIVKLAQSKGIIVNTIQCGNHQATTAPWRQIAQLGQGDYFQVDQSGGAVVVNTPFDEQIAALSREMDETRIFFGNKKVQDQKRRKRAATDLFNSAAPASAVARKAEFNLSDGGARNFADDSELVEAVSSGRVALGSIKADELPPELQELEPEKQLEVVQQRADKRRELKSKITALSVQRSNYVKDELSKTGADKDSLDNKIYQAVREQAGKKGLVYEAEAPKY